MQVSDYGKQQMPARTYWGAVMIVTMGLGALGVYFLRTGEVPTIPRWWNWAILALVWSGVMVSFLRNGRKVLTPPYVLSVVACTLVFGVKLAQPQLGAARNWAENIGYGLLSICSLAPFLQFGKRRRLARARV